MLAGMIWQVARVIYWLSATVYGVLGIAAFAVWPSSGSCEDPGAAAFVGLYFAMRCMMGILQILIHMLMLCPARVDRTYAERFTNMIGGGDHLRGVDKFYSWISACNVAILFGLAVSGLILGLLGECDASLPLNLEIASLAFLAYALVCRLVAAARGRTRQWFRLNWPDADGAAPVPSGDPAAS